MRYSHYQKRAARDHVIDLLGFGDTAPLVDLPVDDDNLQAPYGESEKIPIGFSQKNVEYSLVNEEGDEQYGKKIQGTGVGIELVTPPITEGKTFRIKACKTGYPHNEGSPFCLIFPTDLKVSIGLNTAINAEILNPKKVTARNNQNETMEIPIVDHGSSVTVELKKTQVGVDYTLYLKKVTSNDQIISDAVRGEGASVSIKTNKSLTQDSIIYIHIKKDYLGDIETEEGWLEAELPVFVKPKLDSEITLDSPIPTTNFGSKPKLKIAGGDPDPLVFYRSLAGTVQNNDYFFTPQDDKLSVTGDSFPLESEKVVTGFWVKSKNQISLVSNGKTSSTVPILKDTIVKVEWRKDHDHKGYKFTSFGELVNRLFIPVRPNPKVPLNLHLSIPENGASSEVLKVSDGQPGVYYYFKKKKREDAQDVSKPAYFHYLETTKEAEEPHPPRGIGETKNDGLRIGFDFSIADVSPDSPGVVLSESIQGKALYILARKAFMNATTWLESELNVPNGSEIEITPTPVVLDNPAEIRIKNSKVGVDYQLLGDQGASLGSSTGSDDTLVFSVPVNLDKTDLIIRSTHTLPNETTFTIDQHVSITAFPPDPEPDQPGG